MPGDSDGSRAHPAENLANDLIRMDPIAMDPITFGHFLIRLKQLERIATIGDTGSVLMQARRAALAHWRKFNTFSADSKTWKAHASATDASYRWTIQTRRPKRLTVGSLNQQS